MHGCLGLGPLVDDDPGRQLVSQRGLDLMPVLVLEAVRQEDGEVLAVIGEAD